MPTPTDTFWSETSDRVLADLQATPAGLTSAQARTRLATYGPNALQAHHRTGDFLLFLRQFQSPLILLLLIAAGLSFAMQDRADATIIFIIVLASGVLGFWQERGAADAVAKLLAIVQVKASVLRDGQPVEIPVEQVVPGDVVVLSAGDLVPGDCLLLDATDLYVDEATLTGETFPVEKALGVAAADAPIAQRLGAVFMGTHIVSGSAHALVARTGKATELGQVSARLEARTPETEFEHGVRRFGYFLMQVSLVMVIIVFAINVFLHKPILDSFMFSLALAVGMTPQLLPAIITINLAHGAKRMAADKVIVKRLNSIENFGSMNVLCSDKTGTLTAGHVEMRSAVDIAGKPSDRVLLYAFLNASFESGFVNPIDQALRATSPAPDISAYKKLDEVPYDFNRKRLSIVVAGPEGNVIIAKGALNNVLQVCTQVETAPGQVVALDGVNAQIDQQYHDLSGQGFRVMGLAYKPAGDKTDITKDDEAGMIFLGLLVLFDPPKPDVAQTINDLTALGVTLKIITGDNRLVAASVCSQVGLSNANILAGPDLHHMSDDALAAQVNQVNVFAEVEPNQKERIILALRKAGNVVGYMGDGINDASALHAADVGISVNTGVDVAKEAAQIVLLEQDLSVLVQGVREGRMTFSNTLKYVFMATSANFGNMFSMAGASLFMPFLPLLAVQVLLINLMEDFPQMAIATDSVDPELVESPRRWRVNSIRAFMVVFGPLSSVWDYATFGVIFLLLHNTKPELFRAGWFVESVISAALVVLVIRTRRPMFRSKPGTLLTIATVAVCVAALILPYTALGTTLGFVPLPLSFMLWMGLIVLAYIVSAEITKSIFYKHVKM
jgi:Mg2+-importing ATPase